MGAMSTPQPQGFEPPERFTRKGMIPMLRVKQGPWQAEEAPAELVTRMGAANMEFRVGNIVPTGTFSLFALFLGSFGVAFLFFLGRLIAHDVGDNLLLTVMMAVMMLVGGGVVLLLLPYLVINFDYKGAVGDGLTVFDRKRRKVYQRAHSSLTKGKFDWDRLVPYIETRHRGSAINYALTYVEFNESTGEPTGFATVEVQGINEQPLLNTCAYIAGFMENGIVRQPPTQLSPRPFPGWYRYMPAWCFGLPAAWARSVWAFLFALFSWPVIVWSRLVRRIQPYNQWPKAQLQGWQVDNANPTPEEAQWLQANLTPPPKLPWMAYVAFVAAMLVSAPLWWKLLHGYIGILVKFFS